MPTDPREILPRHALVDIAAHGAREAAAPDIRGDLLARDGIHDGFVAAEPFVGFALSPARGIDGEEDCRDTQGGEGTECRGGFGAVGVEVQLEEKGVVRSFGDDAFEWVAGCCGELDGMRTCDVRACVVVSWKGWGRQGELGRKTAYDLENARGLRCSCERLLGLRVDEFREARGTDEQRHSHGRAENGRGRVDVSHVLHHPWPEPDAFDHGLVLVARPAVRGRRRVEGVCFLRRGLGGDSFEVIAVRFRVVSVMVRREVWGERRSAPVQDHM